MTVSIKKLTLSFNSVLTLVVLSAAVIAIEDKTCTARVEFTSFEETVAILSKIIPTVAESDLVITFANSLESPALLPALVITFSINLFT